MYCCDENFIFFLSVLGEDFMISGNSLTFGSGNASNGDLQCIEVTVTDDDIFEGDQQFTATIDSVSPSSVASIGSPNSLTVTIEDNNGL